MDRPEETMLNAGLIFIYSVWLQGQMSDLVILKKNPDLIADFIANPAKIPAAYQELRVSYWERQFGEVKKDFLEAFSDQLTEQELKEIDEIYHVRNMIGHAHVSGGRDYMLYRPGNSRKEKEILAALNLQPVPDQANPLIIKLPFGQPEVFKSLSDKIEYLDQVCFAKLAAALGVPHGRIR
ncbi:hypothetical protein [Xanthomonas translucens]|uniref:hypothetical protein n=1 Tax=Xanthomonas campestris pv. translucens TaxID=343 RepID=UPI0012D8809C|nr:hypothetical protein [Xanthomonas translucens]